MDCWKSCWTSLKQLLWVQLIFQLPWGYSIIHLSDRSILVNMSILVLGQTGDKHSLKIYHITVKMQQIFCVIPYHYDLPPLYWCLTYLRFFLLSTKATKFKIWLKHFILTTAVIFKRILIKFKVAEESC